MVGAVSTKFIMADEIGHSTEAMWCWGKCRKEFSLRASQSSEMADNGGYSTGKVLGLRLQWVIMGDRQAVAI